jgi:hypothetical protein
MQILWITNYGPEDLESSANRNRKLSKGLAAIGVRASWLYPPKEFKPQVGESKVSGIAKRLALLVRMTTKGYQWAKKNPDGKLVFALLPLG